MKVSFNPLLARPPVEISIRPWHFWIVLLIFILLVPYPLFHGLDSLVLRLWDESRRGVNAYEMLHNGNLLVSSYDGKPDMWGTKPTLLVVLQAGLMWLLGPGELAVRLPSALAGLFTCLFLVGFSARYLRNPFFGLIWVAVLITFNGYVDFHGTRTGDYDALLTLFMLVYAISFFLFTTKKESKYILYTALFITLSVMIKGVAGLLFLPALVLWALYKGSLKEILISRQTWIGAGIFILVVGGYYFSREMVNPGYLRAVAENELGGRYLQPLEGHQRSFFFFVDLFASNRLIKWAVLILPGLVAGFFLREKIARELHAYSLVLVITHLLVISFSGTKLAWYDLPEYPFLAFFIANFIWLIVMVLYRLSLHFRRRILVVLPLLFLLSVFYEPIRITFKEACNEQERPWNLPDHEIAIFLREGVKGGRNLDGYVWANQIYHAPSLFYIYLLKDHGQVVQRKAKEYLSPGDRVIVSDTLVKDYIEENYCFDILESREYVRVYAIH